MQDVKSLQKIIDNSFTAIRAVSVTNKVRKGRYSIAFGHLLINPEDFDSLEDKTCKYPIMDIRNVDS